MIFLSLVVWFLAFECLGLLTFPLLARIFPGLPDRGYGLSKICGFCLFGYLCWAVPWFAGLPLSAGLFWLIFLVLALVSHCCALSFFGGWRPLFQLARDGVLAAESVAIIGFGFFVLMRSFQPEIFWGEKPMDFTFLNYLIRLDVLPPQEPWTSGFYLRYYYMGTYFFAAVHRWLGIDSGIGYNLAIASVGSLFLSSTFGAALMIRRNLHWAILAALLIGLGANPEVLNLALLKGQQLGFDLFWASTRIHTSPAFAEYPLWSFIFADLHAHMMALPVCVALIGFGVGLLTSRSGDGPVGSDDFAQSGFRLFYGFLAGCIFAINAWDFITHTALLIVFLFLQNIPTSGSLPKRSIVRLGCWIYDVMLVCLSAAIVAVPFKFSQGPGPGIGFDWVLGSFSTPDQIVRHLGCWLLPLSLVLLFLVGRGIIFSKYRERLAILLALFMAFIPFVLGVLVWREPGLVEPVPWSVLAISSFLLWSGALGVFSPRIPEKAGLLLVFCAGAMLCATELVYVMDRMNTIFKFYHPIWQLLGLATFTLVPGFITVLKSRKLLWPILAIPLVAGVVCIGASAVDVWSMATFRRVNGPRYTLDGLKYLESANADEAKMLMWMRANLSGVPVMIEAYGNSYAQYTRVAMNTGLSTVLGWDYHVQQRGVSHEEIEKRKGDILRFYSSPEVATAAEVIDLYGIELVVVGAVERDNYQRGAYWKGGLMKFQQHPELFRPIFRSGSVALYATPRSKLFSSVGAPT